MIATSGRWPTRGSRWASIHSLCALVPADFHHADAWIKAGYVEALRTPDSTMIFVTPEKSAQIRADQQACMGCLSACRFSNWSENEEGTTGKPADPRSYCIQKTLQEIAHDGDVDNSDFLRFRERFNQPLP